MRRLRLGVVISTSVHAVVIGWVATHVWKPRARAPSPPALIEIVSVDRPAAPPPEPAPLEVALLDAPPPDRAPSAPPPRVAAAVPPPVTQPAPRAPAIVTSASPPGATHEPGSAPPGELPGPGSAGEPAPRHAPTSALAMRRPGDLPSIALPAGRWDNLDHVPRGTNAEVSAATGILQPDGGGTLTSDQGVFVGKVAPDGSVKITDSRNLSVHLALPSPRQIGNGLSGWYNSDKLGGTGGDQALARSLQMSSGATTNRGDRTQPNSNDQATTAVVPIVGGHFDVTDWLMRRHGTDPYSAKKLKFLDATRDERVQLGNRHRAEQLSHAARFMQASLDAVWASGAALAERKQALFELWDDCAEAGDPALVAGGEAARRLVIAFIQLHLPPGAPDAFTADELAALARRRQSKAAFQPYD